jgi:hypothetical protein
VGWKQLLEKGIEEELLKNCFDCCCILVLINFIDQFAFVSAGPMMEMPAVRDIYRRSDCHRFGCVWIFNPLMFLKLYLS